MGDTQVLTAKQALRHGLSALLATATLLLLAPGGATAAQPPSHALPMVLALTAQVSAPAPLLPTDVPTDVDPLSPPSSSQAQPTVGGSARTSTGVATTAPAPSSSGSPAPASATAPRRSALELGGLVLLLVLVLAWLLVHAGTLRRMLHAWWSPRSLETTGFAAPAVAAPGPSVSVLVAARHEDDVLAETLHQLAASDHAALQVLAIVGDDDPATMAVALSAVTRHPGRVQVVVDHTVPRSKHAALDAGLVEATGEIVAVLDAEDDVHPHLVSAAVGHLVATGVGVLQTGVQQVTARRGWWAVRACLADHFVFRSELHALAAGGVLPVAGTGVFVRRALLEEVGGWRTSTLADADLAIRLQARGVVAAAAYDPVLAIREETPADVRALVRQRARRDQGSLQVLRHRAWRQLTTGSQRWLAARTLARPYVEAALAPVPIVLLVLWLLRVAPNAVNVLAPVVLALMLMRLLVEAAGLREMGRDHGLAIRPWHYALLMLSAAPYRLLLTVATARALVRELVRRRSWLPTEHSGAHRPANRRPTPQGGDLMDDLAALAGHGRDDLSPPEVIDLREPALDRAGEPGRPGSPVRSSTTASSDRQ